MRQSIFYFICCVLFAGSISHVNAQSKEEDVVLRAMEDELHRNMVELKVPEYDKPFFMMFGVRETKSCVVAATLGSLTNSTVTVNRFKTNTRILVGDYDFNDESLEDNLYSQPTAIEIGLPVDNDYWGIRRAFWSTADKVYRDAARHFEKHKTTLKESGKSLNDLPHRSFAKSEPVRMVSSLTPYAYDKAAWENKIRQLSAVFLNRSSILNSAVIVQYEEGHQYLVSSEGTIAKLPFSSASLMVFCQTKSNDGEFALEQISHQASSMDKLPDEKQLIAEIEAMIKRVEEQTKIPKFTEEYSGPVLLMGESVADFFTTALFSGKENIMASDNIAKLTGYQYNNERNSMDLKIGKPIFNESISLKARPTLKNFNGVELLGSYTMDDEGIVPPDELVIVEKGVLKQLLNNRTLTHSTQVANGFSSGPGVLEISLNQRESEKVLKERLLAQARKEGLEYAIIVRDDFGFGRGIKNVYKVSVADGKEELLRHAMVNVDDPKILKRIVGATEKYAAYNQGGRENAYGEGGSAGFSVIVPAAILLEEADIEPFTMPTLKEEEYVSNPLVKE